MLLRKIRLIKSPSPEPMTFQFLGPILDLKAFRYNPCNDFIFPSVLDARECFAKPLARFYLYYAPHDAPGGICLAVSDYIQGPWKEYGSNPIVTRSWEGHYEVSHISSPHAVWRPDLGKLLLYFHGENDTSRVASSTDGISFHYEKTVISTAMFEGISEASYARVFDLGRGRGDRRFVILFMGNNAGTRRIYAAWSPDGLNFTAQKSPLINPPPGTRVSQIGAPWLDQSEGKNIVWFHGDQTLEGQGLKGITTDLYRADLGDDFDEETHLGMVFQREIAGGSSNMRASDPCLVIVDGQRWLFLSIGGRLDQNIALAAILEE